MRTFFVTCAQSRWLREQAARYRCVRRTVSRLRRGETVSDALAAAAALREQSIGTIFTQLGENVSDLAEAEQVTVHYLDVLARIRSQGLRTEVSVKLTQLGLDLNPELCYTNLVRIIEHAGTQSVVWIDMEASNYVDATLTLYRRAKLVYPHLRVCLQAYLFRTTQDLASLVPLGAAIRLVKGASNKPPEAAFPRKHAVVQNYLSLPNQPLA